MIRGPSSFAVRVAVAEPCISRCSSQSQALGRGWPPQPLRAVAWCHSSHGIILDESLSAHIKEHAPVEPRDYRRAGEREHNCDESYLPYLGTQQLASFAFHCRSTRDHNLCN